MGIQKNFFMEKVVRHWDGLPRKMEKLLSLEVFKKCVDVVLRFNGRLGSARVMVGLDDVKGLFKPK